MTKWPSSFKDVVTQGGFHTPPNLRGSFFLAESVEENNCGEEKRKHECQGEMNTKHCFSLRGYGVG